MKPSEKIKALRAQTGMSQSKFADYFGIPVRTIQKWECKAANPPEYIPKMMERILQLEKLSDEMEK